MSVVEEGTTDKELRTLWCGSLSDQVDEEILFELFLNAGPLENVTIPRDKESNKHKNYAFILFQHVESTKFAFDLLNGTQLYGVPIKLTNRALGLGIDHGSIKAKHQRSFSTPVSVKQFEECHYRSLPSSCAQNNITNQAGVFQIPQKPVYGRYVSNLNERSYSSHNDNYEVSVIGQSKPLLPNERHYPSRNHGKYEKQDYNHRYHYSNSSYRNVLDSSRPNNIVMVSPEHERDRTMRGNRDVQHKTDHYSYSSSSSRDSSRSRDRSRSRETMYDRRRLEKEKSSRRY